MTRPELHSTSDLPEGKLRRQLEAFTITRTIKAHIEDKERQLFDAYKGPATLYRRPFYYEFELDNGETRKVWGLALCNATRGFLVAIDKIEKGQE